MGALKPIAICLAVTMAAPAGAGRIDRWQGEIEEASRRFDMPEAWIRRVIGAESGGRTMLHGRPIESRAGAMGLMQLMPGTWREMRAIHGLGGDPHDPRDNILAGTGYLRLMHDRFGYPGLFAAYNAGPVRYARHLATGRPLPAETVAYMAAVAGRRPAVAASPSASTSGLFALAPRAAARVARSDPGSRLADAAGLFALRHDASR